MTVIFIFSHGMAHSVEWQMPSRAVNVLFLLLLKQFIQKSCFMTEWGKSVYFGPNFNLDLLHSKNTTKDRSRLQRYQHLWKTQFPSSCHYPGMCNSGQKKVKTLFLVYFIILPCYKILVDVFWRVSHINTG